jgi:hypothetical protein
MDQGVGMRAFSVLCIVGMSMDLHMEVVLARDSGHAETVANAQLGHCCFWDVLDVYEHLPLSDTHDAHVLDFDYLCESAMFAAMVEEQDWVCGEFGEDVYVGTIAAYSSDVLDDIPF